MGSVIDQLDTLMNLKEKVHQDVENNGKDQVVNLAVAIQSEWEIFCSIFKIHFQILTLESIDASHTLFNEVLARREKADSSRIALSVLNRYKFLFCLPNSIERNAKRDEFDIIVNDYARAKNLFGKTEVSVSF